MKKIMIETEIKSYPIYIGECIDLLHEMIDKNHPILIITDENVKKLYLKTLLNELSTPYVFSLGTDPENKKNLITYDACCVYCLNHFLDRHLTVIAFGGGAVGDFSGFFASTYKRGVKFINIPTTLLAHDSSVGGKTALNVNGVKNAIGSFYQPEAVIYHLPFLKTLNKREVLSGFGEIIKHDLLSDHNILDELIHHHSSLTEIINDYKQMEEILYHAILVKKVYIESDIYDTLGKRQYLNLGHTLGHAVEILTHQSHGEAISFGMLFDLYLSENLEYEALFKQLMKWGYFQSGFNFNADTLISLMKNDKKNEQNQLKFIGLKAIGEPIEISLTTDQFKEKYHSFMQVIK